MDGDIERLKKRFEQQLQATAELAAELQAAGRSPEGRLHYSMIELAAHEAGRQLSQRIQSRVSREVVADAPPQAACPACGRKCPVETHQREVASIDGPVALCEARAFCDRCRRSFFPSA
jgi:DNA repair exonuclease SbcCD ATPase subunit